MFFIKPYLLDLHTELFQVKDVMSVICFRILHVLVWDSKIGNMLITTEVW